MLAFVLWFLAPKVWRHMRSERLAANPTFENLTEAIHLEPDRAEYRNQLGMYFMNPAEHYDRAKGTASFVRATQLNPAVATYWLSLANAYQDEGRAGDAERCVKIALQHDPRNPQLAWLSGNMKVMAEDYMGGLEDWRTSIQEDPVNTHFAFDRGWQLTRDTQTLLDHLVPASNKTDFQFLDFLSSTSRGDPSLVWKRILERKQPFEASQAASYLAWLLRPRPDAAEWRRNLRTAKEVWTELFHPVPTPGNLIFDGGFEGELQNMGFGWHEEPPEGASVVMDYNTYQEGHRSVRIDFARVDNAKLVPLYQVVPVEPGHRYVLTGQIRADGITGGSAPRLAAMSEYYGDPYAMGRQVYQSSNFSEDRVEFTVPAGRSVITVAVLRPPSTALEPKISGSFWVDNVTLTELGPAGSPR